MKLSTAGKSGVGDALKQDAAAQGVTITPAEIQAILQVVEVLLPIIISIFAEPTPAPAPAPAPAKP